LILKAFHIILAFLLLISTSGFMVSKHFCQGELKSIALLVQATPCHQNKAMKHCPMHAASDQNGEQESKGCCDTENDFVKAENEQLATEMEPHLIDYPVLLAVLAVLVGLEVVEEDAKTRQFLTYKPPLLVCDLPVRLQTFLC
jgi:hypothetical protein